MTDKAEIKLFNLAMMRMAVVLLICVPLIPVAIAAVQTWAKKLLSKYWGQYTELGDTFLENLQGLTTLKIYQANSRIIDGVAKRLKAPKEKFPRNIEAYGNTCAASIPILLDEWNRSGRAQKGQRIVLSGFGAGLIWGAAYLEW